MKSSNSAAAPDIPPLAEVGLPGFDWAAWLQAYAGLAGSAALTEGRNSEAAKFLELARSQGGDDPAVSERAFTAALMAGDIGSIGEVYFALHKLAGTLWRANDDEEENPDD